MPVFNNTEIKVDFDGLSRDVVTLGLKMVTRGFETGFHSHRKAQCVMAVSGVLTCEAEGGIGLLRPRQPLDTSRCRALHHLCWQCRRLQRVRRARRRAPSSKCCSISATSLLRELMVRTAHYPTELAEGGMESRVAALLLEEISISEAGQLHLPMPRDKRLRKIFQSFMKIPLTEGRSHPGPARWRVSAIVFGRGRVR